LFLISKSIPVLNFFRQHVYQFFDSFRTRVSSSMFSHGELSFRCFPFTNHQHERHFFHLSVADLGADLLAPEIGGDPEAIALVLADL